MRREDKRFWTEWQQAFPKFNLFLISSRIPFWLVSDVPKYLNFATFSNNSLALFIFWFCPEFGRRHVIIYFVLSAFISRPTPYITTVEIILDVHPCYTCVCNAVDVYIMWSFFVVVRSYALVGGGCGSDNKIVVVNDALCRVAHWEHWQS
jgi:hypothetical protein